MPTTKDFDYLEIEGLGTFKPAGSGGGGSGDFVLLRADDDGRVFNGATAITGAQIFALVEAGKAVFLWDEDGEYLYASPIAHIGDVYFFAPAFDGNGFYIAVVNENDNECSFSTRPAIPRALVADAGKVLTVDSNGEWTKQTPSGYVKPSGGIPKTDLASAVQTSLGKADTAVQPSAISDMATETWVENKGYQTAPFEIQITQSGSTYSTTATAQEILDNADNCIAVLSGGAETAKPDAVFRSSQTAVSILFTVGVVLNGYLDATQIMVTVANGTVVVAVSDAHLDPLPSVAASDNGKFLRVVNGAWAAATVPAAESNSFGGGS